MDFDPATGTMVGDGNGNKLVVGKAKPELLNRFGFLLPPNEVSTYLRDSYQSSYWKATVAQIEGGADYVVQGPASSLPNYGTAANPVTVVVDGANSGASGNLSLSGNITGYGLLVVRGTYSASGNVGWNGVVLVIGQGNVQGNGGGSNSYNGAMFVANTRDPAGNLLPNFGIGTYNWNGGGGNGIQYNSCDVNSALTLHLYRVLSFHEIMQ